KLTRHLMQQPPLVQSLRPEVPAAVAAIVRRLMAKDPQQRFQTPAELVQELPPWWGPGSRQEVPAAAAESPPDRPADGQQGGMEGSAAGPVDHVARTVVLHPARPIDAAFREKWHHWLAIVEVSVKRRGARHWINPRAYQALQAELMKMCRVEASSGERERRAFFQRLQGL